MFGRDVNTRGGVFGGGGYGGGVFSGMGGLSAYEQAAAGVQGLGLLDPENQKWNTPTYQACIGVRIQKCGLDKNTLGWSDKDELDCFERAQATCIAQVTTATPLSNSEVRALQQRINVALKSHGYCPISEDGLLGPITCGASAWAVSADPSIIVPAKCGSTIKMGSGFLKDCPKDTTPITTPPVVNPVDTTPVVVDTPPGTQPPGTKPPGTQLPAKSGISTAWIVGGVIAAIAAVGAGVYFSQKG